MEGQRMIHPKDKKEIEKLIDSVFLILGEKKIKVETSSPTHMREKLNYISTLQENLDGWRAKTHTDITDGKSVLVPSVKIEADHYKELINTVIDRIGRRIDYWVTPTDAFQPIPDVQAFLKNRKPLPPSFKNDFVTSIYLLQDSQMLPNYIMSGFLKKQVTGELVMRTPIIFKSEDILALRNIGLRLFREEGS